MIGNVAALFVLASLFCISLDCARASAVFLVLAFGIPLLAGSH